MDHASNPLLDGSNKVNSPRLTEEELRVKQFELEVRRVEAEAAKLNATAPWWRNASPLVLAVMGGVITLLGNIGVSWWNGHSSIEQEKIKAQNQLALEIEKAKPSLILQAVSTSDPATAQTNLLFFLASGLLKDENDKIQNAALNYSSVLPSAAIQPTASACEDSQQTFWSATLAQEHIGEFDIAIDRMVQNQSKFENVAAKAHTS